MTPDDDFATAARAEAQRRHSAPEIEEGYQLGYTQTQIRELVRRTFIGAAEWARAHIDAQAPRAASDLLHHIEDMADSLDEHVTQADVHRLLIEALGMARALGDGLATQEPTEDDVQAGVAAILALTDETEETARMDDIDIAWDHARAALSARQEQS